jgi:hypothetical protein
MKSLLAPCLECNAPSDRVHEKGGVMAFSIEWLASSGSFAFWRLDVTVAASPASVGQIAFCV